ncbi:MAG: hypothetical protein N2322_00475 [Terrimicrobiaceae bacterium]|nr:hypothetical protein [Terrimicrobiaceae bacterium]
MEGLIAQGDAADARHDNRAALALYERAAALSHDNPAILRRIAKQKAQLILEAPSAAEKKRLAAEAVRLARRAASLAPNDAQAQLTLAIVLGRAAFLESPREKIASARDIRAAAEKAVRLDPSNDLAWHVLGRWHFEMATLNPVLRGAAAALFGGLPGASLESAASSFRKAIAAGPPRAMHHIEYGRTLAALNRREEAIAQLRKGLAIPDSDKDDRETKNRGRETLRKLL